MHKGEGDGVWSQCGPGTKPRRMSGKAKAYLLMNAYI